MENDFLRFKELYEKHDVGIVIFTLEDIKKAKEEGEGRYYGGLRVDTFLPNDEEFYCIMLKTYEEKISGYSDFFTYLLFDGEGSFIEQVISE